MKKCFIASVTIACLILVSCSQETVEAPVDIKVNNSLPCTSGFECHDVASDYAIQYSDQISDLSPQQKAVVDDTLSKAISFYEIDCEKSNEEACFQLSVILADEDFEFYNPEWSRALKLEFKYVKKPTP